MSSEYDPYMGKAALYVQTICAHAGCVHATLSDSWMGDYSCEVLKPSQVVYKLEGFDTAGGCNLALINGEEGVLYNANDFEPNQ